MRDTRDTLDAQDGYLFIRVPVTQSEYDYLSDRAEKIGVSKGTAVRHRMGMGDLPDRRAGNGRKSQPKRAERAR